jgi:hypothetical protein
MLATPDSFRPNQSPLGAFHPAPGSHVRRRSPSPELPFDGSGVVTLSSTFADSRDTAFVLTESRTLIWAYLLCFSGSRPATGRQAEVCLRPLIHQGQIRASRPPPLQHRVPIRAASKVRKHLFHRVSFTGLLRSVFSHSVGES